jgi:hypothetical protein
MSDTGPFQRLEPNYPLHWPMGWKRTQFPGFSKFGDRGKGTTMGRALDFLQGELRRLYAKDPVISTNVRARLDGRPYANEPIPRDRGAAVYFTLKKRRVVLACDKWNQVQDNLWAIAKHIEAMRGQERWGVGSIDQAFAGYMLVEKTGPDCWETLGVVPQASVGEIMAAYRVRAKRAHPDMEGGSHELMMALNEAKDIAIATAKARGGVPA